MKRPAELDDIDRRIAIAEGYIHDAQQERGSERRDWATRPLPSELRRPPPQTSVPVKPPTPRDIRWFMAGAFSLALYLLLFRQVF